MPGPARPARAAALAAALALALLTAACGPAPAPTSSGSAAGGAIRVSGDVPLPATGADDRPGRGPPPGADLSAQVAALPGRTVVAPRPALAVSRAAATGGASAPPAAPPAAGPRLAARGANGAPGVAFPLVHTRVVAQISGALSRVEVTQYFQNPSPDRLEAIYAFPLPPDAAVTDMVFRVGGRVVRSEIRRREEARRIYEGARREGRTAALTEQERPNLFTQSVANVPPGETVAVVLRYVHEVPFQDGRYAFHFPTTLGPRYVPGAPAGASGPGTSPDTDRVPDASRITPPVLPPGVPPGHDVDVLVRLVPGDAFEDVAAASHRVVTGLDPTGARLVALAEDDRAANRDVILSWRPASAAPAVHALVQRERGEDFVLLFVQPPAEVAPAMVRAKELVFLLDKSGSMMGAPIERAKALIDRALDAMGPDDTFQIVAFDGGAQSMTAAPLPGTAANRARARAWLGLLEGGGGTEMLEGVRAALEAPLDPRRLRMVVFCTDGFIGNEPEIIEAVGALRGPARVFGFGIGSSVNRYLVEGVARAGRGAAEVVDLKEPVGPAVERLFRRLDRPVLTELEATFEGGGAVTDLLPARLPDLFAGQPLQVAGRLAGRPPSAIRLTGRLGEAPWAARLAVAPAPASDPTSQPVAGTLWARRRIEELLSARPASPAPEAVEEVVRHALRFALVTPYTSFVAVERELRVDPALPLAQVLLPNELPEGVSPEGILGPASVVQVLPARVKPGDPELRVETGPGAVSVRVALPFEARPREAIRDPRRGDFVLRFLVPPGWPDGSYDARIRILRADGSAEERTAPIRVDTTPAALAVLAAPARVHPGERFLVAVKPALPAARLPALAGRAGGLGAALKGAMEVKEVLVRAPWGEIAAARLEGPAGVWRAALRAPEGGAIGAGELELVASDAAGNVARRRIPLTVEAAPERSGPDAEGLGLLAALLLCAACGLAWLRA